ncbi:hypothetical protein [Hydrogenophaga sp.]|uniref:hypothetical protein n=1 Tax=Hydrogenophaga sp. TaxID=1904254 RepID=UPI002726D1B4|nr:hypothetical protein [Hydrogenophaga sp.]MDO9436963.1 hypothetical protein [Hydrogenophaga sp.]
MINRLTRMLRVRLAARQRRARIASLKDVARIRQQMERSIEDCPIAGAQRLRKKIDHARTPQDLWLLRNDAYQLISQQHDQTVAASRINTLMHCFEGWLEPKQLVRIK